MNNRRSLSSPLLNSSSLQSISNSFQNLLKLKKRGDNLVIKVFKTVARIHNWNNWLDTYERFKLDGYDDLNQAQFARVADLMSQYQLEGKIAVQLYLELQKEHKKQENPNQPFFPTKDEIENISLGMKNLHKMPAQIRFQSSKSNHLQLHLIILFGSQNSGKSTFISACINFIRRIEYHSLLRYTVQKDEKIIKIDDGQEQYCFIKVEAITNPYENRFMAINLRSTLKDAIMGRQLSSFSVLYFALSTQTRIGVAEKYQVQKILETVPLNMKNFFIIKTFCTSDKAEMVVFTGDQSPAHLIPGFIENYILKTNSRDGNKEKYIFNNKLLSYEYRNRDENQNQNPQNLNNQNQMSNDLQGNIRRQSSLGLNQSQISNNKIQQQSFINQENQIPQIQNQVYNEQSSLNQSQIQDLSMDKVDMTYIYWMRNKENFIQLKKDITEQQDTKQSGEELTKFLQCLKFLKKAELQIEVLMENKKNILKIEQLIDENIENLQIIKTQLSYIYIDHKENKIHYTPQAFAHGIQILICKLCNSICHQACQSIEGCNRLKNNVCKSCFQNRNQKCSKNQHRLIDLNVEIQTQIVSIIQVKAHLQESKDKKIIKDQYIRNIRLFQSDLFKLKRKYIEEVQKLQQFIDQNSLQTNQLGFLKLNFKNYTKQLEKIQLDDDGIIYQNVISDLIAYNSNMDAEVDQ